MALNPGDLFRIDVELLNPKVLEQYQRLGDEFDTELEKVFKKIVFDINKYLIRITPAESGQLRGGWTAFLDSQRESYSQQIRDTTLAIKSRNSVPNISDEAIAEGKKYASYEFPNPLNVSIINGVPYASYIEHGTSRTQGRNFTALARYKGELRFREVLTRWFNQIGEAGRVVPLDFPDEDINP